MLVSMFFHPGVNLPNVNLLLIHVLARQRPRHVVLSVTTLPYSKSIKMKCELILYYTKSAFESIAILYGGGGAAVA
jgi:hypothetical protein